MSTRSQKRKAGTSVEETEGNQQENLLRVSSVVIGEDVSSEPSTSTNGLTPQVDQSLENLKTSLRKEITEEVKTLLEQSQRELILAIRSSSLENRPSNSDEIIETPTSVTLTPTKTVRFGNVNSPVSIRNMVTGVLPDPINPKKKSKTRTQSQSPLTERTNLPEAAPPLTKQTESNTTPPMPKALTTSLPTFDGKNEKCELFEDLFRNNIRMHPHLTEIQRINYFHSLLRGEALQAFRNLDDTKKNNLEDIMTTFKRRFGDYLSVAKARCEWDTLKFDPTTQKLHEFLDSLQKTAKEAFGPEAQQFIDKAIYAKMPDHVQKILNRAYLEDKPYNEIVLHLEREMRLNGLGTPDEITLVPLNNVAPTSNTPHNKENKRGLCFHCSRYGHYKAQCRKLKRDKWQETRKQNGSNNNTRPPRPQCVTCGKPHKTEDCWNGANAANDPRPKRQSSITPKPDKIKATHEADESKNSIRRDYNSGKQ